MEGMGVITILACSEYYFIKVHETLVQDPSNNKSIVFFQNGFENGAIMKNHVSYHFKTIFHEKLNKNHKISTSFICPGYPRKATPQASIGERGGNSLKPTSRLKFRL